MKRNLLSTFVLTIIFAFTGLSVQANEIVPKRGIPVSVKKGETMVWAEKSEAGHVVLEDFEGAAPLHFQVFANGSWEIPEALQVVPNPDRGGLNPSAYVLQFTRGADGDPWAGFFADLDEPIGFSEKGYIHFQVWKPIVSRVLFKIEGSTSGAAPLEIPAMEPQETADEWVNLVFDLTEVEGEWERITFFLDFPEGGIDHDDHVVMYMDNIIWSDSPEPTDIPEGLAILSWDVAVSANTPEYRQETYSVYISTEGDDPADFTMLFEETLSEDVPRWTGIPRQLDISEYAGQEVHVAFRHYNSTDKDLVIIDNVKIHMVDPLVSLFDLVVFHEDFSGGIVEEVDVDWLPEGWQAIDADGDGFNWFYGVREGNGAMRSSSYEDNAITPDNWLITPAITLEAPEVFTVTFVVEDEDGEAIGDAVVTLGTVANAAGSYVFEDVPAGTYSYSVVAEGYLDVEVAALAITDDRTVTVVMEEVPSGFEVTFNVNMAGAVAWEDLVFDPDIHRVWVTGSFAEWAQPGTNPAFELHPADAGKNDLEILYPGNWENRSSEVTMNWSDDGVNMGYIFGTNSYGDAGYGQIFRNDQEMSIHGGYFWIGERNGAGGDIVFTLWDYSGSVGSVLASKTFALADVDAGETFDDALYVEFDEPVVVTGDFFMGADISDLSAFQEGSYGIGNVSSANGNGGGGALALVQEGTSWVAVSGYGVDVDVAIFPVVEKSTDPLEPMIYTLTTNIPEGEYEYKYFLVTNDPTWDNGEWPGDPNRELIVEGPMVVNDVFGEQPGDPTNVDEPQVGSFTLYPNPVRDMLNIQSASNIDQIRVFDLSGRVIHQAVVNDTHIRLNVNPFNSGMYILQIISGNDVRTERFQVYK